MKQRAHLLALALAVVLFAASIGPDAAVYERVAHSGGFMLALGWFGPLTLHFGWYANPLLLVSWLMLPFARSRGLRLTNVILASFALLLGLSSYLTLEVCGMIGRNEGETAGDLLSFGPAIFLWTGAIVATLVGTILRFRAGAEPTSGSGPRS